MSQRCAWTKHTAIALVVSILLPSPVHPYSDPMEWRINGESLVLTGTTPGSLLFDGILNDQITVRSTYEPGLAHTVNYEVGLDYVLDPFKGQIARTKNSRIPDFSTNVLFGKREFDHNQFPGFGNTSYFVFVDYTAKNGYDLTSKTDQASRLPRAAKRLRDGGPFKIVAYGDSITAGGDATSQHLQFQERYGEYLRQQFPKASITVENGATGGDSTVQGLVRLEEKVLTRAPDLVLIGFGMNDHNVNSVPIDKFESNLISIVEQIRNRTGAEVILYSTFPPNDDWKFGSHRMPDYAAATKRAAELLQCAYADVNTAWNKLLERKDAPSLLGNNINHPNDFGHWVYFEVLKSVGF